MGMPNVVLPQGEYWTKEPSVFTTNPRLHAKRGDLIYVGQGNRLLRHFVAREDGEVEVPVREVISGDQDVMYGRVFAGRWQPGPHAGTPPCVRCVKGQRPPGVGIIVPCCP